MQTNEAPVSLQHGNVKVNRFDGWLTFAGLFTDVADCEPDEPLIIGDTDEFYQPYHRQGVDYTEPAIQ